MKTPTKNYSELYSPEMKLRISEAHSMIMEQAGDLNLSTLIPNWKKMKMVDLINAIEKVSFKLDKNLSESDFEKFDYFPPNYWSSRWRSSKFGKMSPDEIMEYATQNENNRKEVRDFVEKEYVWYLKNAPEGLIKKFRISRTKKNIERGIDPFDYFYTGARLNNYIVKYVPILTLILQLLLWLTF